MAATHPHHHPPQKDSRLPERLNAVDWAIYAIVVACILLGWAFSCSGAPDVKECMRHGSPKLLGVVLQAGILVLAVWTGSEVGRRRGSGVIGLVCGTVIFFAGVGLLGWFGVLPGL